MASEEDIKRLSTNPEVLSIYFYSLFFIAIIIFSPYRLFVIPVFVTGLFILFKYLYVWIDFYDDYFVINSGIRKNKKIVKYEEVTSFVLTKTYHAPIYNGQFSLTINFKNKGYVSGRPIYDVYNYNDEFYFFLSKRAAVLKSNY